MIKVERGPEPPILTEKKAEWLAKFLAKRAANPTARPDPRKYAHPQIKTALRHMSHGKCFYCERKLSEAEAEVDHHVEVADDPSRAFDWDNLYLSCGGCNQAKRKSLPKLADCVNPCATDAAPEDHLTFDDEHIRPWDGSQRGRATIKKYDLDRIELEYERLRALRELDQAEKRLHRRREAAGRPSLSDDEREILDSFGQPERPFSLMLRIALRALDP